MFLPVTCKGSIFSTSFQHCSHWLCWVRISIHNEASEGPPRGVSSIYMTHFPLNIRSFGGTSLPLFFIILVLRTVSQQKFHCMSKFANLSRMWMCQTIWQMDSWDPICQVSVPSSIRGKSELKQRALEYGHYILLIMKWVLEPAWVMHKR